MGISLSQWATGVQLTGTLLLPFSQITLSWPHTLPQGRKLRGRSITVMAANMALMSSWDMGAFPEMPRYLLHQQIIYWQAGVNTAVMSCMWAKQPWVRANRWDAGGHPNSFLCLPGAATGTTAATTRQRRKAATPKCSATSGRVSRTPCSAVRKGWLLSHGFPSLPPSLPPSLLCWHQDDQRALGAPEAGLCLPSWFQSCFRQCLFSSKIPAHSLPGAEKLEPQHNPFSGNLRSPQAEGQGGVGAMEPTSPLSLAGMQMRVCRWAGESLSGDFLLTGIKYASSNSCGSSGVVFPLQFWRPLQQECPFFFTTLKHCLEKSQPI